MDDLDRNVWCLLGLPFDAVTIDETIEKIHHLVRTREKCLISTPNLNFLITSQKDSDRYKNTQTTFVSLRWLGYIRVFIFSGIAFR